MPPEKNLILSSSVSPQTFGHTGFTGTCVWVDPQYNLVYIFLSNRVYPTRDNPKIWTNEYQVKDSGSDLQCD